MDHENEQLNLWKDEIKVIQNKTEVTTKDENKAELSPQVSRLQKKT